MKLVSIIAITIFLIGVCISGCYSYQDKNKEVDFYGVDIPEKQLSDIMNTVPEGNYIICDMKENDCTIFQKGLINGKKE